MIPDEISKYMAEMGKKGGKRVMEQRGSEWFKKISLMRKTFGRKPKTSQKTK